MNVPDADHAIDGIRQLQFGRGEYPEQCVVLCESDPACGAVVTAGDWCHFRKLPIGALEGSAESDVYLIEHQRPFAGLFEQRVVSSVEGASRLGVFFMLALSAVGCCCYSRSPKGGGAAQPAPARAGSRAATSGVRAAAAHYVRKRERPRARVAAAGDSAPASPNIKKPKVVDDLELLGLLPESPSRGTAAAAPSQGKSSGEPTAAQPAPAAATSGSLLRQEGAHWRRELSGLSRLFDWKQFCLGKRKSAGSRAGSDAGSERIVKSMAELRDDAVTRG